MDAGRRWPSVLVVIAGALLVGLYAFTDHNGEVDRAVMWAAAVGQVAFVGLWATQRWWSSTIGRALMAKSAALAVVLTTSVWVLYFGPLPLWLGRALFGAVTVTILGQAGTMAAAIVAARRESRGLSGMPPHDPRRP